jgi:hypothetical protein
MPQPVTSITYEARENHVAQSVLGTVSGDFRCNQLLLLCQLRQGSDPRGEIMPLSPDWPRCSCLLLKLLLPYS